MTRTTRKKCRWCGKTFKSEVGRRNNAVKYCSSVCRLEARRDSVRRSMRKYRMRHNKQETRGHLLGESRLNENPCGNWEKEEKLIKREIRRIGL